LAGKRRMSKQQPEPEPRELAYQAYLFIQDLANSTNSMKDPVVIRALKTIRSFPDNKKIAMQYVNMVRKHLKSKEEFTKRFPNPFLPNPTDEQMIGDILIGNLKHTAANFGINLDELKQHTLITGRSGSGKTTLIYIILAQLLEFKVPFWVFDFKQDYRHLAKTGRVLVFDYESFRFNPLRPPEGVKPKLWMQSFSNIFCQAYYLLAGTKKIVLDHIDRLYSDYGVFSGSDRFPTMLDFYDSLQMYKPAAKSWRELNFWESAVNRTRECLISYDEAFDCDRGFSIEDLLENNVVLELEGLVTENQDFLMTIILRWVFQYRINRSERNGLRHIFLFDEGKRAYNRKKEFDEKLGTSEIAQFTSTIREFGEGLVVADQIPAELGESIKSNVYTMICMSQSGIRNIMDMGRSMSLNKNQSDYISMLKSDSNEGIFEAIVKLSSRWQYPFLVHIQPLSIRKDVTNDDIKALMLPHIERMNNLLVGRKPYQKIIDAKEEEERLNQQKERNKRREEAKKKKEVEGNILIKILTNIREQPFISQKERIKMLQLKGSTSTTNKYFNTLIHKGLATKEKISIGKDFSATFYDITDNGAGFAKMTKVAIPGKAGFKHKFCQHKIKEFYENLGFENVEIEKRYGLKNVDIGFKDESGNKAAVEIELNNTDNLVLNVHRDLDEGVEKVVIVAPNKRRMSTYKKRFESYSETEREKLEFRVITDFL
jgi:energy-coupling factor transporter ATP-binding protein EcfA2